MTDRVPLLSSPHRATILIAVFGAIFLVSMAFGTGPLDRGVLLALYAADEPWLALAAMGFTFLANWSTAVGVTLVAAAVFAWRKRRREALTLLLATLTGRALVVLEKEWFARLRPEENLRLVEVHYLSFPSGHSANGVLVYVGIAMLAFDPGRRRDVAITAAVVLAFLIGLSRPMLGVHWPSDVLGGWAFGALWLLLTMWTVDRLSLPRQTLAAIR